MAKPRPGDRVRVTYEALVEEFDVFEHGDIRVRDAGGTKSSRVPPGATIEVTEPADDPSKDLVGTVRSNGSSTAVKTGNYHHGSETYETRLANGWVLIANGAHVYSHRTDKQVTGWKIIGYVPGTPAEPKGEGRDR